MTNRSLLDLSDPFFSSRWLGFENLFDSLRTFSELPETRSSSYPPYNLRRDGNEYTIEVAVAGLGDKDIEVETKDNVLSIKHDNQKNDKSNVVHRGIAARSFLLQFTLSPEILVKGADLNNGLLSINMMFSNTESPNFAKSSSFFMTSYSHEIFSTAVTWNPILAM